nr:alpha-hydroxy acid oxidase [Kibdelosporangium sp. MJ126-NF4]CEL16420.1 L-lactate dehydrogenase [Kibdelosporangium sp. MJ126-NF4]CTQ90372.1 L-lactate dehydrogenase (EC 1.1.2.3) [Kibdelosporangium sp. MJ126-NF4]
MAASGTPLCLADIEQLAAAALSREVRDFVDGGSGDERALARNRTALDDITVLPRVLAGVQDCRMSTELVGTPASMPVAVAPMAYQKLMHPGGEREAADAAAQAGVPFVLSTMSSCPVEEVADSGAALWFQVYWLTDRDRLADLVRRAEGAGCRAIMATVDVPVLGSRRRDERNEFVLPESVAPVHLADANQARTRVAAGSAIAAHTNSISRQAQDWSDIEWLRGVTRLPIVLKGVLDPRDARRAVESGVDAVVVSNHGGRQFDGAPASVEALPAVVEAVAGGCEVLLDSGIRSGIDVLRALVLGASGVLVGRPVLWGLAWDGAAGVGSVLSAMRRELAEALVLTGCESLARARELRTFQGRR